MPASVNNCTAAENILEKLDIAYRLGSAYKNGSAGYDAIKNYILAAGKLKDILSLLQSDYAAGGMLNKKITAQDFADILYEAVQGVEIVLQINDCPTEICKR